MRFVTTVLFQENLATSGRSSRPEVFSRKGILKIRSKFTGEHPCRSVITIKLQSNFIEITLRHRCSPVKLQHIFRTSFSKNTSGRLLLFRDSNGDFTDFTTIRVFTGHVLAATHFLVATKTYHNFSVDYFKQVLPSSIFLLVC